MHWGAMRARASERLLITGLAFVVAGSAGCASAHRAPPPSASSELAPTGAASSNAAYAPRTAGERVACALLPVPSSAIVSYATHDCWIVRDNTIGNPDVVFLGGVDPDDSTTGVVLFARFDVPDENLATVRLPRHGDLTITLARKAFACLRARDGTRWRLDVGMRQIAPQPRGSTCAAR